MALYAEERQQQILSQAKMEGRVQVATLAAELAVTQETIRRDLDRLEQQGLLRRIHGGAIPVHRLDYEPHVELRETTSVAEKAQIANAVLPMLPREGTLLLDAGTSTARLAALLPDSSSLTVVTNSLPIASTLAARPQITVHLIGGRVRGATLATVDTWALHTLSGLNVDVVVLGTNGFSLERGLTTPDLAEAAVKKAMVTAGRRRIVLADSMKYGDDHFARFADLRDVDTIVTDAGLDARTRARVAAAGPEVVVADAENVRGSTFTPSREGRAAFA